MSNLSALGFPFELALHLLCGRLTLGDGGVDGRSRTINDLPATLVEIRNIGLPLRRYVVHLSTKIAGRVLCEAPGLACLTGKQISGIFLREEDGRRTTKDGADQKSDEETTASAATLIQ